MDSPAVSGSIGGMCSPPDTDDAIRFHSINDFWNHRSSNRIFRKSPLSDADRTITFLIRYSIYPYTQTHSRSAGEYKSMFRRICLYKNCPAVNQAADSGLPLPSTAFLFSFSPGENACQYRQSESHKISVFPVFFHIPPRECGCFYN